MDDFLVQNGLGIESVITRFSDDDSKHNVTLYPMLHFGLLPFYEKVIAEAGKMDAVLYENFDSGNENENFYVSMLTKGYPDDYHFDLPELLTLSINLFQSTFASVSGLAEQSIMQSDFSNFENFYATDLSSKDQTISEQLNVGGNTLDGKQLFYDYIGRLLHRIDVLNFADYLRKRGYPDELKSIYIDTIDGVLMDSELLEIIAFSKQRENFVLESLDVLRESRKDCAVIYGAAHMNSFSDHLKKNGYQILSRECVLAIPSTPPILEKSLDN